MSSLNQKKATKAACKSEIARFSGVSLIQRGGLPLRIPCLAMLLLCGCASTASVTLERTDDIRGSEIKRKSVTTLFRGVQASSLTNPRLEIRVLQRIAEEETFQRRYIKKSSPSPGDKAGLWIIGIASAGAGYYFYQQGRVVLGRDLMGLGLLIPLGGGAFAGNTTVGEQWKPESKALPPRTAPAANTSVVASVGPTSWTVQTDADGLLALDISNLADMAEEGEPLTIGVALQENPTQKTTFTVPASIVAFYRPSPPVEEIVAVTVASETIEAGDKPTLAILDFEGLGISEQEARVLTNRLGTHMVQLGRYQVIERGQMQQVLEEQDFQLTGCTSNECAVEIGQLIGAQQMLAGSFGKFGSIYTIDMRIIDVATGSILRTTSYDVQGEAELLLTVGLAEAARRIAGID